MSSELSKKEVRLAQLQVSQMRAMRSHAVIVSGAYKLRKIERGVKGGGWRPCTDDEKLADELGTMNNHIRFMQDIFDALVELETE